MHIASITGPGRRKGWRVTGSAILVSAVLGVSAAPAHADDDGHSGAHVTQTNLVANRDGFGAAIVDPDLQNAWGMSKRPTSPVWVSNNHSDTSTLYRGGSAADPASVAKVPLTVTVPGGPTGQVSNTDATGFNLSNGGSALFIFATEEGKIFGWNQAAGTAAEQDAMSDGANYKGLAQGMVGTATYLYAADFAGGKIDVFDNTWTMQDWGDAFHVRHLPKGFSPFNVQALTDPKTGEQHVWVAYAKLDPATGDEVAGQGLGLIAEFTTDGHLVRKFRSGSLDAPWGLAYAPASWGKVAGDLLVGQFGNGMIEIFDRHGHHVGTVRDDNGHKLVIDGLWALMAGDTTAGGDGTVLFTAGPNDETDGLYGVLTFAPRMHHGHDDD